MRALASLSRGLLRALPALLVIGILVSCATKKTDAPHAAASAKPKSPSASPTPKPSPFPKSTPAPAPTPAPTPQARYIASVKVEGGEATQTVITPDNQPTPTPGPTPSTSPAPALAPSPTPAPKFAPLGLLTGVWQKVFPPKATPAPTPSESVSFRVSTSDNPQPAWNDSATGPAVAQPGPTPIELRVRPSEGFVMRMWHTVFPKKEEPPAASMPQWIGTIKLVNERDGYALIDSQGYFAMAGGETLNSVGADTESGVLRVTADKNPPFFIADIVSGKPRAGDRVYSPKP